MTMTNSNSAPNNVENIKPRVLVVDDEPQLRRLLQEFLKDHYTLFMASNGKEAIELAKKNAPDLIVMDISMPEMDGFQACEVLRQDSATSEIPILFLTAYNSADYRVKAFNLGADDFISKPIEFEELLARLRSKYRRLIEMRRLKPNTERIGNLSLLVERKLATIEGKEVKLTPLEFGLLRFLMSKPGQVASRTELLQAVWKDTKRRERVVDVQMTLLRKKISDFSGEIRCLYGEGYVITDEKTGTHPSAQEAKGA